MAAKKNQHVTSHPNGNRKVKVSGNSRAITKIKTQDDKIKIDRSITNNQSNKVIMPRSDGSIQKAELNQSGVKDQILTDLKEAFEDIKLYEQEKKKLKTAKELLNEL